MGKKSGPKAPTPPDPTKVAAAQADANKGAAITQANLNRIDQYTPQGSITYQQIGTWPDGTPRYAQTQQYSPEQQALYDQENQIAQALGGLAQSNIGRVADVQSQDFNFNGMQPLATASGGGQGLQYGTAQPNLNTNVGSGGNIQSGYSPGGGIQSTFGQGGPLTSNVQEQAYQNRIADAGDVTRNVQQGNVQGNLDFGGSFNPGDFNQTSQAAADAVYKQAASRLDPQYQQLEADMRNRLINSGITENSAAFQREMDNFARQRSDAYNQATYSSIGAGLAAQQQGYGQALGTRQQNVGEITAQGQFANSAQNQQFQQGMQNAALNNAAQGQVFGQNAAQLEAFNQAQGAQFNQGMQNAQLNNAAQGQQYQQNLGAAQFGNQAQQQQNQQNMQQAAFGNAAQDQQFQQNLASAGFSNDALAQMFGMGQANAALNNQTQNLAFNQQLAGSQFNNDVRQRQIEEATYLRNLPLNDIAALLGTGGGVQQPQFNPVAQVGVAAPDYQGAVYNNYNAAMNQYNQAQANRSAGLGSIFGLAGTLGAAVIPSDRRLKHGIKRIGTLLSGLNTYVFSYLGSTARHFGVMAQEVKALSPDAVVVMPNGYMAVDYRKVW